MPPKQSAEESQSGSGAPRPATSRSSAANVKKMGPKKIEELYYKPANEHYRRELPKIIYYDELETIRREKPIVDPKDAAAPVVTVEIWERPEAVKEPEITTIGDDDEEEEEGKVKVKPLPFKKTAAVPRGEDKPENSSVIGLSDSDDTLLKKLRRTSPHDFTAIRKQLGYRDSIDDHFGRYKLAATTNFVDRYSKSDPTNPVADPDLATMLGDFDWSGFFKNHRRHHKHLNDAAPALLYKGFPMVEKVVFVMHPNDWKSEDRDGKVLEDGHCYWASIALLIYGSANFWLLVKAEHLWYLESILDNPHHPRYDFYKKMMDTKFRSHSNGVGMKGKYPYTRKSGAFNLWEALHIPGCWVNHDPCYLTADLYNVFLVLYKYSSNENVEYVNKVYDMKTFGAYNSRHVFLCYAGEDHYRPMLPNDYLSYEFRLPRLTLAATKMYKLQTAEHNRPVDGLYHHWRAPLNSIPSSLSLPRGRYQDSVTESHIYRVVGYDPPCLPAPAKPKRKREAIVIDDDDDPKPPSPKHVKVEKTASQTENAEATKPVTPTPTPAPKPTTPTPAPKPTTPVKYIPRIQRLPSPSVPRPFRPPNPNCPVVIPPVGKAFEAFCGEWEQLETPQGQSMSTALTTRGPFGLTALSSRPPPDLTKLYTYFPHYDRQLLDSFYAWLIQPENIVKPVHQILDALELGNQQFEQAKNPALAIRSLLGLTADIAAVVTLLTRYDFRLLLEFYSYEMKVENKAGKSAAQLLDELEKGHYKWTKDITAPRHSGVHPGIIYTLEMMLGRYDPTLLADLAQWAKLSMSACSQAGQCQGLGKEKKWSNAQLVQLLEEEHQRREEVKRVELETKEAERRVKEQLEQQDRVLAHHREWEARYFREQFWSKQDTMEVEMTGQPRSMSPNAMDLDEPDMGMMSVNPFAPGPPPDGTVPMDMGPDIDMDADGDMDMGADQETEVRRERERYMEEAKLKVRDLTDIENYKDLFISPRKPQIVLTGEKQAEKDLEKMKAESRTQKPEEKLREREPPRREQREAKEKGEETAADKAARQMEEIRRKNREKFEKDKLDAEKEKQERPRGRSRAGSASRPGSSARQRSVSRAGSSSTAAPGGRPRRTSLSRTRPPGPTTPSRMREETRRSQLETENVIDENPMALVLARPPPPTLKLRPATPPKSNIPAGDDPFGPPPPTDTTRLDPKRTAPSFSFTSTSTSNAPSSSTAFASSSTAPTAAPAAPRLDLRRPIKPAKPMTRSNVGSSSSVSSASNLTSGSNLGSSSNVGPSSNIASILGSSSNLASNVGSNVSFKKPTTPGKQPVKPMQRFDPNTATRHSNFNPNVGSKPNTAPKGNTLNPSFNPQPRGPSRPSPGSSSGPSPGSSSGFGSGSSGRPRAGSGSGAKSPTRIGRRRANSNSRMGMPVVTADTIKKGLEKDNVNINPMALALGSGSSGFSFGSLTSTDSSPGSTPPEKLRPVRKPVSSKQRPKPRVEKPRQKVAKAPWLSDVQEVDEDEDLYGEEGNEGGVEEIKVEVQGQGGGDVIDGSLRIEELGDDDEDFYIDDNW